MELKIFSIVALLLIYAESRHPVILLPGDGGSRLLAKLEKPYSTGFWCAQSTDYYYVIWLDLHEMIPWAIECFIDNMKLHYNNVTRRTANTVGVKIVVPGFGQTHTIEYLDDDPKVKKGHYFGSLVRHLVNKGYERKINLKGAPYDFRKAPNEQSTFFENLKSLIENSYAQNKRKKVVLVGHSMGCPMLLYFLNQMDQSWKDQYIKSLVTLSAPFSGTMKSLYTFISGNSFGDFLVESKLFRGLERTFPSLAFFLPSQNAWNESDVLVRTPNRKYTANDYEDLFHDMDYVNGYDMWLDTRNLIFDLHPPGVETHCFYGVGVDTIESLEYKYFPSGDAKWVLGDGDGTVNRKSLEGCKRWIGKQKQKVRIKHYFNVTHMDILKYQPVIDQIYKIANGD